MPSCWVLVGGSWAAGAHLPSLSGSGMVDESCALCSLFCFVYSVYLYRCCDCFLCLLFCQTALIPNPPGLFCLFLSILLRTPVGGGAAAWHFCCWPQPNHNSPNVPNLETDILCVSINLLNLKEKLHLDKDISIKNMRMLLI